MVKSKLINIDNIEYIKGNNINKGIVFGNTGVDQIVYTIKSVFVNYLFEK